jgi:protein import protein ZIM17
MFLQRGSFAMIRRSPLFSTQRRVVSRALCASQTTLPTSPNCRCGGLATTSCRRFHSTDKNNHGENKESIVSPQDVKLVLDADVTDNGLLTDIPGAKTGKGKKLAIVFTCTVCETRSAKQFTEQAYRNGVVLVRCPGCENLHLIADRLGYFEDKGDGGWDIEKAMAKMGENVRAVTNDNVMELTLEDVIGQDKMEQALTKGEAVTRALETRRP